MVRTAVVNCACKLGFLINKFGQIGKCWHILWTILRTEWHKNLYFRWPTSCVWRGSVPSTRPAQTPCSPARSSSRCTRSTSATAWTTWSTTGSSAGWGAAPWVSTPPPHRASFGGTLLTTLCAQTWRNFTHLWPRPWETTEVSFYIIISGVARGRVDPQGASGATPDPPTDVQKPNPSSHFWLFGMLRSLSWTQPQPFMIYLSMHFKLQKI